MWKLSNVRVSGESKIATNTRSAPEIGPTQNLSFYLRLQRKIPQASSTFLRSPARRTSVETTYSEVGERPHQFCHVGGPQKCGLTFGISLLSSIETEITRFPIFISGTGGHLQFNTYPDIRECSYYSCRVARPQKWGCSLIIFEISLPSSVKAEICVFQVYRPPSWISLFRFLPIWSYNIATAPVR